MLLGRVLRGLFSGEVCGLDGRQFASLIVQVWSESMRNEHLAATFEDGYGVMRLVWTDVVEGYREAGILRADVPADHVARAMMAATQGFFARMALFGDADPAVLEKGMRGLMAMDRPETG
ncbi:TetR family transcriptional regulator C-terminal domain-containing protein [Streptomyces sp. NPDC059278]|uniref:TetR family transcriptional regulator C-terminal domain-containing protein n=1 Tax=Streptomyces sp. NPDC059278 TaxID=3346801 RepID=UPI0036D07821